MPAIIPNIKIDHDPFLSRTFLPYQPHRIQPEDHFHSQATKPYALAQKSVRIGSTSAGSTDTRKAATPRPETSLSGLRTIARTPSSTNSSRQPAPPVV